jgi:hypothetical protein
MVDLHKLDSLLIKYQESFNEKIYSDENDEHDLLMAAFGISPELKRENRQYWGRELGKCWESLVVEVCKTTPHFKPALRIGSDEPCDLILKEYAIDTKYRVGSGDSGTLKKFKQYGPLLKESGLKPVFLFLRTDNLPAAITACKSGGWELYIGQESFDFLREHTGFDLKNFLEERRRRFLVNRNA